MSGRRASPLATIDSQARRGALGLYPAPSAACRNTVVSVLAIKPVRIGGIEIYARELSAQLGERGWRSVLCFLQEPSNAVQRYLSLPNVTIETVSNSMRLSWAPTYEMLQILRRYQPRILHLQFTGQVSVYPWLARLRGVEKVFFTDQASRPAGHIIRRSPLWKRMAARAINHPISCVIGVSDYNRRCLEGLGVLPPERLRRIYNATLMVQPDPFRGDRFRKRFGIPSGRVLVIQVSTMIPEKGFEDLIRAARLAISAEPNIHFAFVGEGLERRRYMHLTGEAGLSDHVTWTGIVENPLEDGVFHAADIVCQMSRWEEAFGLVIAEAMAHSRPVIATRVGGIPELVTDGATGFLVERGDYAAAAARILELARDRTLREGMGQQARRFAEQHFDIKRNVAEVLALYGIAGTHSTGMTRATGAGAT